MAHAIEAAKSARSTCATCGEKIAKGEVRVAELYQDASIGAYQYEGFYGRDGEYGRRRSEHREPIQRFHHLECAVDKHPSIVRTALGQRHHPDLIPDRKAFDARLEAALEAERKERVAAATARLAAPTESAAADPNLDPLLAQLADSPDDPELIAIIGDLYQSRGDPRGELIAIQIATKDAKRERGPEVANPRGRTRTAEAEDPTHRTMVARRDELITHLTPRLDSADRSAWGIGFVRRLELGAKSSSRIGELAGLWTHPSFRVISELKLELPAVADDAAIIDHLVAALPKSIRKLEVGGSLQHGGSLGKLVAALPRLEELALLQRRADPEIAHARLARLVLVGGAWAPSPASYDAEVPAPRAAYSESLGLLSPKKLPAVREIVFREWAFSHDPLSELARTPWVKVLDRIRVEAPKPEYMSWQVPALPLEAADQLRAGLRKRKLARLEIVGVPIPLPVRAVLGECAVELDLPATAVVLDDTTTHVTHAAKPEWGRGKIVKRAAGKLEVKFPKQDVKVFKADAPFLVPSPEDD